MSLGEYRDKGECAEGWELKIGLWFESDYYYLISVKSTLKEMLLWPQKQY